MSEHDQQIKAETFCQYLEGKINASNIKQTDMAAEMGFAKPNIITMFKQGKTRVPLCKVPEFARILKLDPVMLLRRAMLEYEPELLRVIESTFFGTVITKNEQKILDEIRRVSRGTDPEITSIAHKASLEEFVNKLMTKSV